MAGRRRQQLQLLPLPLLASALANTPRAAAATFRMVMQTAARRCTWRRREATLRWQLSSCRSAARAACG